MAAVKWFPRAFALPRYCHLYKMRREWRTTWPNSYPLMIPKVEGANIHVASLQMTCCRIPLTSLESTAVNYKQGEYFSAKKYAPKFSNALSMIVDELCFMQCQ